jgi:hypothetical protein
MATVVDESEFFTDIMDDGYHVFSITHAKTPGFYPNEFPDYLSVKLNLLIVGDQINIRAFSRVGSGENVQVDGGYIDLEVELIESDHVFGVILTELPKQFPLEKGSSLEIRENEILYKMESTVY